AAPAGLAAVAPALPFGLEPGGAADALDLVHGGAGPGLVPRLAFVHDRIGRIVLGGFGRFPGVSAHLPAASPAPATAGAALGFLAGIAGFLIVGILACGLVLGLGGCFGRFGGLALLGLVIAVAVGLLFPARSEEHTSELQSRENLVCRLLLEKKKTNRIP